jgi:hypothetical protein
MWAELQNTRRNQTCWLVGYSRHPGRWFTHVNHIHESTLLHMCKETNHEPLHVGACWPNVLNTLQSVFIYVGINVTGSYLRFQSCLSLKNRHFCLKCSTFMFSGRILNALLTLPSLQSLAFRSQEKWLMTNQPRLAGALVYGMALYIQRYDYNTEAKWPE